ncbi:MAG TPA: EAL domain-containing protein [Burkholderiaceae bacterium]
MFNAHSLLLRQLKRLGIEMGKRPANAQQWLLFLDRVNRAYTEADQERYLMERSQEIASREMQELYGHIEEAQRIAGLGNWSFDRTRRKGLWSKECARIFGCNPPAPMPTYKELSRRVHREDRVQVKDRTEAAFHDGKDFEIEFRWLLPDGATRWLRVAAQVQKDESGKVVRLHGTVMNVTARKLVELRQAMEHTVTRLLAEAEAPLEVMPEVIETICETADWKGGVLWTLDKAAATFNRGASWCQPQPRIESFFRQYKSQMKRPQAGSPVARVLLTKAPVWYDDAVRGSVPREPELRSIFALPILAGGEIAGMMEFFNDMRQFADPDMLLSAHFIGRHIGQFFQRSQAEAALRESEAHFRSLVEQASDSFFVHDVDGRFVDVNQRACESLGYTREELLRMNLADVDLDQPVSELRHLRDRIDAQGNHAPVALESRYRRKNGKEFPVEIRMGPIDIDGQRYLLSLVRDVTERKEMQDHIEHLAFHDPLTELPNRAMFNRHLNHAIAHAQRYHKGLAVLFIDLDRFKNINDTLGHDAGDRLLKEMANRISSCLRQSDVVARTERNIGGGNVTGGDLVARLGGDEFVVLIEEVTDTARVSHIARKLLTALVREFPLEGQLIHVTASIGISTFPEDGRNEFSLMKHADIAMYRAKERGKNTFQFYSAQMDLHSAELLALESGLRRSLERKEFVLFYQPKVEARTGRITGVEALVRWQHPELGLVSPVHFIPLAEESGLIGPLSQWVIQEALSQNRRWQGLGLPTLRMAINLSARQFVDEDLLTDTLRALKESNLDPSLLELEITESMMMHNTEKTVQILSELRRVGIRIAIDDFGIGYSSLSHLKRFPIDTIKIDRSFIEDIPGDKADEAITEAIIAMSKSLQIKVVAEGVESLEQLRFLRARGCDEIQGYFFSRPVSAAEFARLLTENSASPRAYA